MSINNPPNETNKYLVFGQCPKSWTKHLEPRIRATARQEGRNYFYAASIDIRSGSREHVEAWVPGLTAKSVVKIDVHDETVSASCTCQSFRDHKNICSHIWARRPAPGPATFYPPRRGGSEDELHQLSR